MRRILQGIWLGAALASLLMAPLVWAVYAFMNDELKRTRRLHANEAYTRIRLQQTYANATPSPYTIWWGEGEGERHE